MTEIAQELLEGVQIGDCVKVRYGTDNDQDTVVGTVVKLTANFLHLKKKNDSIAKIRLDDLLRSLDPVDEAVSRESDKLAEENIPRYSGDGEKPPSPEFRNMRQMVTLLPAQPYNFTAEEWLDQFKKMLKVSDNLRIKKMMNGILDSLKAAIKNGQVAYKYHNLRAKIHQMWEFCAVEADYTLFYLALGVLAIIAKDYLYALEPLTRARKYSLAAYAAAAGHLTDSARIFSLCALLSKEKTEINQYISGACISQQDVEVLRKLLSVYQDDSASCEKLASCAFMLFAASGGRLEADITPYDTASAAAEKFLKAVPQSWTKSSIVLKSWEEFRQYSYPEKEKVLTGRINTFSRNRHYGFISPDHYFYIKQVRSDTEDGILLRKALFCRVWNQLEVSFQLGQSNIYPDRFSASNIELTAVGRAEALRRIARMKSSGRRKEGFVETFCMQSLNGRIQSGKSRYKFSIDSIDDPFLRAYYRECFSPAPQNVTFEADGRRAFSIQWKDPLPQDRNAYASCVSGEELHAWKHALEKRNGGRAIFPLESDPYIDYPYVTLTEGAQEGPDRKKSPLSWNGRIPGAPIQPPPVPKTVPPSISAPAPKPLEGEAKVQADLGRRAMKFGRLEKAEEHFTRALEVGGFNEGVVCDFITLCTRIEGRTAQAEEQLLKYSSALPEEKLRNLKIQIYEKAKDYKKLCPLYEESFHTSASVSRKSNSLLRLIDAHVKLGEYMEALEDCKRWETLYTQNRFSADAKKLKNAVMSIERQKAICYYHTGRIKEAQEIATNLIRANPADVAANSILEGTLAAFPSLDIADESFFEDDNDLLGSGEPSKAGSQISAYVRNRIQQTDIANSLKSSYLKDGKYTGSSKAALDDVKKMTASGQRISSKARSEAHFAACNLLEQIEQRGNAIRYINNYKCQLAGRAMASWGDYMVSQANQLDTTRMAYLYALRVLTPTKRGKERDWINSYNRYIKSFFMARIGNDSLDYYINQQINSHVKDGANTDIFENSRIPDVLISEFLVGILHLIDALKSQPERQEIFIDELYLKNPDLRKSVCRQLSFFVDPLIPETVSNTDFHKLILAACESLNQRMNQLNENLVAAGNLLLSKSLPPDVIDRLDTDQWSNYLTATDVVRLGRIHYVLKRYQDYFGSGDFENRADCLRVTILEINELIQIIQNEPTDISYDIFYPALEQMTLRLADQQISLYQNFLPKLSWWETIQPFRTPEGYIQIQLTVKNESNYQSADNLEITGIYGPEVRWLNKGGVIQSIRGGEETELGICVSINEAASQSGSFSATIGYSYKCSDSPQNVITKSQEVEFTFVIRNEHFEPLKNPFSAYEGKVMDDDTMFLGRSTQIQQILNIICPNNDGVMNYGRSIAMYGQTRTGKSSLLYHLKKKLAERYQDDILIWDVGNIGEIAVQSGGDYLASFLYTLLYNGSEAIYDNSIIAGLVEAAGLEAPLDQIMENPAYATTFFNTYMKKLNGILKQEHKIIVLFVDEFTYLHGYIKEGKIPLEFMRFWKALLQNYCIFAIVAGQDDMPEFMREHQNEFACMELMKLNYLDERDAKRLIQEPLENGNNRTGLFRKDGAVDELYELTAGSAYLTIILCSRLVNYLNDKGAYVVTKGIVNDFLRTNVFGPKSFLTEVHFEAQLQERGHREFDEANKEIMLSIARLSQTTGYASIDEVTCPGKTLEEIQELVDRLVDRNVLVKEGRNQYWIQVKLLERWLINMMGV